MIIFIYKAYRQKYGKIVEEMENDMLQKIKDPFPKTIADACKVLTGWKNCYDRREYHAYHANDGIAFATIGTEE